MHKLYLYLSFLTFALILSACSKKDDVELPSEFPVTFSAERFEIHSDMRLFSDRTEIKDPAILLAFQQQHGWPNHGNLDNELKEFDIEFQSDDRATFKYNLQEKSYDVQRKGTRFLFYSTIPYALNPASAPTENTIGFLQSMLKYGDKLGTLPIPIEDLKFSTREVKVAHGNYKVFKLSTTAYRIHLQSPEDHTSDEDLELEGYFHNEFNPEVAKFLGPKDTLAVQEYSIIFTIRN